MKEWACAAHGAFEALEQVCPEGCPPSFVVREIRTAPKLRSARTSFADQQFEGLARDFKLPDIANNGLDGASVMSTLKKRMLQHMHKDPNAGPIVPTFIDVPHNDPGWTQRDGEKPVTYNPAPLVGSGGADYITPARDAGLIHPLRASELIKHPSQPPDIT